MSRLPEHPETPDLAYWLEGVSADLTRAGIKRAREAGNTKRSVEDWIHDRLVDRFTRVDVDFRLLKLEIEWE